MPLPFHRPADAVDFEALLGDCAQVRLLTVAPDGLPVCGLFHFLAGRAGVEFHMLRDNPQLADLRVRGGVIEADDYLAPVPSHWVERHDGTHFTSYFRMAQAGGEFAFAEAPAALASHFNRFLRKYQPEGGYDPYPEDGSAAARLRDYVLVSLTVSRLTTRWQLGQNHPPELRRKLVDKLRTRGRGGDPRCADEILRWLMTHPEVDGDPLKYE
jgi:predicted FMN-binding regulatory protein PaiB